MLVAAVTASLHAETLVVTNTNDSGPGSLRQALLDAYTLPGSTINFAIGLGARRIRPLTELPTLYKGSIDGSTQPGYAGTPLIEIDGSLLPAFSRCLFFGDDQVGSAVKALVVNRCSSSLAVSSIRDKRTVRSEVPPFCRPHGESSR